MTKNTPVNWHLAACSAIQIDLMEYSEYLRYEAEFPIRKNYFRIDMLVIKKLVDIPLTKKLASDFQTLNLFEIKGLHSSLSIRSFYKTLGCSGILIDFLWKSPEFDGKEFTANDVTLNLLSLNYPRKLFRHLQQDLKLPIAKTAPGIYDIGNSLFTIHIIVTKELDPEDYLYLHCLTDTPLKGSSGLYKRISEDYTRNSSNRLYHDYMQQITHSISKKGGSSMEICEGIFELFGTSSEEIRNEQKKEYDKIIAIATILLTFCYMRI